MFLTFPRCPELPPFAVKHMTSEHTPHVIYYRHGQKHITKVNVIFKHFKITKQQYVKYIIYFTAESLFLFH